MADKAEQIRKVAERLFASHRYHEVTLDDVCRKAGVGKGTVYRYFKDKEDLFWQVIASGQDELTASVEAVAEEQTDPGMGLREAIVRIAEFFRERHNLFRLVWSEQLRDSRRRSTLQKRWGVRDEKVIAVVAGFIAKGIKDGNYQTALEPAAAARLLLGMVRTALRHRNIMPEGVCPTESVIDLFEKGLLARPEARKKTARQAT
ncbi:MAG: TetR/AcrR family transcriptional regulator [Candidatus Brocadiaceae bacterium]|nr:TetR/AcrR family transcriptional regulator [Candidatus Brocadiaceae bacterium]